MTAVGVALAPSVTLTLKSPWLAAPNDTVTVPPLTDTLALPVAPLAGPTIALYLPLPPLTRNGNVLPLLHAAAEYEVGLMANGTTTSAVPTTLSTVGGLANTVPFASLIANVRPVKQVLFVMTEKLPPLCNTGDPTKVTAVGKLTCTV